MRKNIYLTIVEQLQTLLDNDNNPIIKHFDLWNENVAFAEEEFFATPAVFVEFDPIIYKAVKDPKQIATVGVKLHIVTQTQINSLEYFDLINSINHTLYNLSGTGFNGMWRTGSYTNHDHGELLESIETYSCSGVDTSAV